ncbi:MAG: hypothetical protein HYY23_09535 [Verrucomicrobia bacterium]|nr:hypothetical protein [Verrucomicrobiota bacterium]
MKAIKLLRTFSSVGLLGYGIFAVWLFLILGLLSIVVHQSGCSPAPPFHGTAFVVALDTNRIGAASDKSQLLVRTEETLRKRLRNVGTRPLMERNAEGQLLIKLPQLKTNELASVRRLISKPGLLEFRVVHPESDRLIREGRTALDHEVLKLKRTHGGQTSDTPYLVKKKPELGLTGTYLARSGVESDPITNQPRILLRFDSKGADLFAQITRDNIDRYLAIVLDGELLSAPVIRQAIPSGAAVIDGDFTLREAYELANVLESPLEVPYRLVEEGTF